MVGLAGLIVDWGGGFSGEPWQRAPARLPVPPRHPRMLPEGATHQPASQLPCHCDWLAKGRWSSDAHELPCLSACVRVVRPFVQTLFGMLKASNELIEAMLEILQSRRNGSWLQTAMNVIEFQQMLVQAKWIKVRAMACWLAAPTHTIIAAPGAAAGQAPLSKKPPRVLT